MERTVSKIAALGVPGVILVVAVNATGLAGAAAFTNTLMLLGPKGVTVGKSLFGITGLVADALAKYGFNAIFEAVVRKLYMRGETKESIKAKVERYPVARFLKRKLNYAINNPVIM